MIFFLFFLSLIAICIAAYTTFMTREKRQRAQNKRADAALYAAKQMATKQDNYTAERMAEQRQDAEELAEEYERSAERHKRHGVLGVAATLVVAVALVASNMFVSVPASHVGVVTSFGAVEDATLPEGLRIVAPWKTVHPVYLGQANAAVNNAEAASRDLQSVRATLTIQYAVDSSKARELFQLIPSLRYSDAFVVPAAYEVFKAVTSRYTAEELVTKRAEVSEAIVTALSAKMARNHLRVQVVNLLNFSFSRSFNEAIEAKVTAVEQAKAAQNVLERTKAEAQQRIEQARGEAEAIRIQAEAIQKQGGEAYVQLKTVEKWDGKLPQYMLGAGGTPLLNLK